jgi:predicted ribosomally synthesized peptide with SipW-like signal peptide
MTASTSRSRTARKVLGSLGVIGAAAAVAGMGTFGTFTDSTSVDATVGAGTLMLDLTAPGGGAVSMSAANLVPGDVISRPVELVNGGDLGFANIQLNTTATASSLLDTDRTKGLQLDVFSCSDAWTATGTGSATSYSCSGSTTSLSTGGAVGATPLPNTLKSLAGHGTDHLLLKLSLPAAADNAFQGQTSVLSIKFTGTQQTGTAR